jgi:hypothetical protein
MTKMKINVAVVFVVSCLGCDYYGPKNPPPDPSPNPVFTVATLESTSIDPDGVDGLLCPAGTVVTGGGCDCVACGVVTGYEIPFACVPAGNGYVGACVDGCPTIFIRCASTTRPGTLVAGLISEDPEMRAVMFRIRTAKEELKGAAR